MKKYIFTLLITILILFCIISPESMISSTNSALKLWVTVLVPSLFPFMILSDLICKTALPYIFNKFFSSLMQRTFKLPGISTLAIFLGMIGGYPVGAKITTDLLCENSITENDANHLISFTNNTGPLFLLGTLGIGMYKNINLGILLLISHYLSAIIVGLIMSIIKNKNTTYQPKSIIKLQVLKLSDLGSTLNNSIKKAIDTVLTIGGFIVLFSIIGAFLEQTKILSILSKHLFPIFPTEITNSTLSGMLEVTTGLNKLALIPIPLPHKLILSSILVGFGGFSIHFQTLSIISKTSISFKKYLTGKSLQALISALLTYILMTYTKFSTIIPLSTSNFNLSPIETTKTLNVISIFFLFITIYKILQTLLHTKKHFKK